MFKIGDKISYPMHGAGVIEDIEEKIISKKVIQYFSVNIVSEKMNILVPVDNAETAGIRPLASEDEIHSMIQALHGEMEPVISNWNRRYQSNLEKLKTGDLEICAGVVRNLTLMDRAKGLSSGEKRLLFSAKNFLISQLMMVKGMDKAASDALIENEIGKMSEE